MSRPEKLEWRGEPIKKQEARVGRNVDAFLEKRETLTIL
jgi:hypothetical protein